MRNTKGFTLIELLAIIAIISILFMLLIPKISGAIQKAKVSGIQVDLREFEIGMRSFLIANNNEIPEELTNELLDLLNSQFPAKNGFNYHADHSNGASFNVTSIQKNPFGERYELLFFDDAIVIQTRTSKKDIKRYGVQLYVHDDEVNSFYAGFNKAPSFPADSNLADHITIHYSGDYGYSYLSKGEIFISSYKGTAKDIVIPEKIDGKTVVGIGHFAFYNKQLTSVVLPPTIRSIFEHAFANNNLTSINLTDSIENIHFSAFMLNKLTTLTLPSNLRIIHGLAFAGNNLTSVVIPPNVTEIGNKAFRVNKNLKQVTFNNSVVSIGDSAFEFTAIESIDLPYSLRSIGELSFSSTNLKNIRIPGSLKVVGPSAFSNGQLSSVLIEEGVEEIKNNAFSRNKITTLTLPNTLRSIENAAFFSNELTTLTLPRSITHIGNKAFFINNALSKVINHSRISNADLAPAFSSEPVITN